MNRASVSFTKMCAAGNDFLIIEKEMSTAGYRRLAQKICHRTEGVGADGLLVVAPSRHADARMRIFNADGSEAEMCGNGARCFAAYLHARRRLRNPTLNFETLAGTIQAHVGPRSIKVTLSDPRDYRIHIPLNLPGGERHVHAIDTGVPHAVIFVSGLPNIAVNAIAPTIRHHRVFSPRGANVNFVEWLNDRCIAVRTFERGVEGETRACGTGSVASALIAYRLAHPEEERRKKARLSVKTASGEILRVQFDFQGPSFSNVILEGRAQWIAEGKFF